MELLVVVKVETVCRQETPLEGQKMLTLKLEQGPRGQKEENQEVQSAEREDPIRSQIEVPLLPVSLQPSIMKNRIRFKSSRISQVPYQHCTFLSIHQSLLTSSISCLDL